MIGRIMKFSIDDDGILPEMLPEDLRQRIRSLCIQMLTILVLTIVAFIGSVVAGIVVGFMVNPWAGALLIGASTLVIEKLATATSEAKQRAADEVFREATSRPQSLPETERTADRKPR